uniref:Uncharacterized protein n=1 Tax=Rhizophagus irregularis (strain DAOM 181602 / DAOM 197198 / MUCL 43194) TaxID=747089 RepID=U9UUB2_RHIID
MDSKSDNLKKVESLLIRKVSGNRFFPLFQSLAHLNQNFYQFQSFDYSSAYKPN